MPETSLPSTAARPTGRAALLRRWGALRPAMTWPALVFVAILLLGALLRFWQLGLVRHSYDDSYPAYDALRLLDGGQWLLVGQQSSVFLDNPALMGYLQAIPLLLWRSPWSVYLFVVLLNTAAIWLVYRVARELLGETVALLAAFLFAANPWVVYFSRATWVQALIPFLGALTAWGLWPAVATESQRPARVLAAGLAFVAMTQTYIQAWGALAQVGPLVALSWRRLPRRALGIALAALVLATAVYACGLSRNWPASRAKLARFAVRDLAPTRAGLDHALRLVTGRDFEYVYTRDETVAYTVRRNLGLAFSAALTAAVLTGALQALAALRRPGRNRRTAAVLLTWFALPVLLMSVSGQRVHPHYLLLTCPAGHVLAAWGLAPLLAWRWPRRLALPLLALLAVLWGLDLWRANPSDAARPAGQEWGEWALSSGARVGAVVRELARGSGHPPRVVARAHAALISSLSATYVTVLPNLEFPHYVVLPGDEPLLYVLVNTPPAGEILGPKHEAFPEREVHLGPRARVAFLRALPYNREEALRLPEVALDWPSEAGLSLLGYSLDGALQPGQTLTCTTYWRVDELRPERWGWFVGAFYHLLDPSGRKAANVSGRGQWGQHWQVGDVYVERARIAMPADLAPGECRLEIGLFDTIHSLNYALLAPEGPQYALVVRIAPPAAPLPGS